MTNKKFFMTVTASAAIATAFVATDSADAASYKVQRGDTLWSIAQKNNVTVTNLKSINNLPSNSLYVNQVLQLDQQQIAQVANPNDTVTVNTAASSVTGESNTYTVNPGDTLFSIAKKSGLTVANLQNLNGLSNNNIKVGQKLNISGSTYKEANVSETAPSTVGYDVNLLVSTAKSLIGTPYSWGGTTPSGFDCSGFISYTHQKAGKAVGRQDSLSYYSNSTSVSTPQVGDLAFFSGTYRAGISHLGIYIGNNQIIHAASSGVEITNLNNVYWKKYFTGFRRLK